MASKKQAQKQPKKSMEVMSKKPCSPTCVCASTKSHSVETTVKPKESKTKTKIIARFDCGFPNSLFVRGEGISTLSWDKGTKMQNISPNEWLWESDRPCSTMQFKILINDNSFELGENHTIAYGQAVEITPKF